MRYALENGPGFALARKENVAVDIFGRARLTSKNLMPDPRLEEFEPSGEMRYWPRLEAPPAASGRNVYILDPADPLTNRFTGQNAATIRRDGSSYYQRLALVNGPPMPGVKSPYNVLQARPFALYPVSLTNSGYPAGTYRRSYAWALRTSWGWLLTGPAPAISFTAAEDQATEQPLPTEAPEGVDGIAILDSFVNGSESALFVQSIVDIRDHIPESVPMNGPPRYSRRAPSTNTTYIGALGRLVGPQVRRAYSSYQRIQWTDALVSWKFRTRFGWSASQGTTHVEHRYVERNRIYEIRPLYMPYLAEAWILQVQGPDAGWLDAMYGTAGGELQKNQRAPYVVADPEKLTADKLGYSQRGGAGGGAQHGWTLEGAERRSVDETGIPDPDQALEAPLVFGRARINPGRKIVRVTDAYKADDGSEYEGPPSSPQTITLAAQQGLVVDFREKAEEGNVIPNGDYEDRLNGVPRRFSYPAPPAAGLSVSAAESVVTFNDTTLRTTDDIVFQSDPFAMVIAAGDAGVYTSRGGVVLSRYFRGAAYISLRFLDLSGNALGSQLVAAGSAAGTFINDFTVGAAGSGADVIYPAGTRQASYVYRLQGDANNTRNLGGRFVHIGMFRGKAAPRKAAEDAENPVPEVEPENVPYPDGSYMRVVERPSWATDKGNGFEYYGSALARMGRRRFASGLRLPVEPNRVYCLQGSYYHRGLAAGSELLPISVRNAAGQVVEGDAPAPIVGSVSGGGAGRGSVVVSTGPDAAYVQVEPSTLGPGMARAWGFQIEYGTLPTAWTDDVAASGVLAAAFDTRTPGIEEVIAQAGIFEHGGYSGGGAVADLPLGTVAPVFYRGRNSLAEPLSDYYIDPVLMPPYRYIEVEARPQANAASVAAGISPEISGLFAEAVPLRAVLLRPDGSEYPGGVLVEGMPATQYGPNAERTFRSDGAPRIRQTYPSRPGFEGVTLKAYSDEAVEAVSYDSTHDDRLFLLVGWGKSRLVRIINVRFGVDRTERVMGREIYVHLATDIAGDILREDDLT